MDNLELVGMGKEQIFSNPLLWVRKQRFIFRCPLFRISLIQYIIYIKHNNSIYVCSRINSRMY